MIDDDKRAAALAAVEEVRPGMLVGLGTGSTAAFAIERLGALVRDGLEIRAVATSLRTEEAAHAAGIPLIDFADIDSVDLTIDGADEIDGRFFAIKGAGGAMLREKIVAAASRRMIVIADASKRVERIGRARLPVEILPFARAFAATRLAALGARTEIRPGLSDQGNVIIDCFFADMPDPSALAAHLSAIPGVLGHGLFLDEVDCAYIGDGGRVIRLDR
ncbi:MAG: ribose-5-phosphate isomerase [Sphingomonas bacterium]|uniref:ribose-5-phosphate isomerase RpiA n=1 Tax=Sphingomonas bacterium TaxID=1895847 RepID=UPI0026170E17|nr:ribose-5-phosphate isomerase RpiA [Sphingomonas bacterium]MDB5703045.1 ribose-5-phosphate isomerase [Sphingomonas bacterium]